MNIEESEIDVTTQSIPATSEASATTTATPAVTSEASVATSEALDRKLLQRILEGALLAAAKPMSVQQLANLFENHERPPIDEVEAALNDIQNETVDRGFELKKVASGFRFQVVQDVSLWVSRLWDEKPQKYSRALLETLSLIAYRQPITRGDIENIRGVAVSSHIVKTLLEREWIRVVGHKDVPGRPAMFATTRSFLDYFNLHNLDELPTLAEIRDLDSMNQELALEGVDTPPIVDEAQNPVANESVESEEKDSGQLDFIAADQQSNDDGDDNEQTSSIGASGKLGEQVDDAELFVGSDEHVDDADPFVDSDSPK